MEMSLKRPDHFLYLDGMRGVSALFVGLLHGSEILAHDRLHLPNAALAVDFFFCLSGFVIAFAYADKLGTSITSSQFLLRRSIRLGPVLLVGLLLGAFVTIFSAWQKGSHELPIWVFVSFMSLMIFPAGLLFGKQAFPTNNPVWSLFFEIFANTIYAFFSFKRDSMQVIAIITCALSMIVMGSYFKNIEHIGFQTPLMFLGGFGRVGYPFIAGVVIHKLGFFRNRRPLWSWAAFLALPILLASPFGTWKFELGIILLAVPIIVMAGTAHANGKVALPLRLLGELSYPFYLIHQPIFVAFDKVHFVKELSASHPLEVTVFALILAAIAALALSRLYDIPFRRYLTNHFLAA